MTSGTGLDIRNLSAGYGARKVLTELSLPSIASGQVTALVGPNGAGKTTLLRALAGLVPASGEVWFDGQDLLGASAQSRSRVMAFMPQFLPQRMALSVLESVISALRASPPDTMALDANAFCDAALATLDSLGILELALMPFDQLSGGQRQLVSLAQALVRKPKLLLLDEPTSALDLRHQFQVMNIVQAAARNGAIVIAVLHDLQAAASWADRIVVMNEGKLYASDTPTRAITANMLREVYDIACTVEIIKSRLFIGIDRLFDEHKQ